MLNAAFDRSVARRRARWRGARHAMLPGTTALFVLWALAHSAAPRVGAQGRTVWDRVYSPAQAARGQEAYKLACGYCHKDDLSGGFMDDGVGRAVPLAGPQAFNATFEARWKDQTLADMVYVIASTMPKESPTSLPLGSYVDILTYLLEKNGAPAGEAELPADVPTLRGIAITPRPR